MKFLLTLFFFSFLSAGTYAQETLEQFYDPIRPVQPTQSGDKIEVVEVFWYGCPHCYTLEPYIQNWLKTKADDVMFRRVPGILGRNWIPHARAFFTAEKLGVVEQIHTPLFTALHKDKKRIFTDAEVKRFFLDATGVSEEEFDRIYNSREIDIKIRQAQIMQQKARLSGVPSIIVNGKYLTGAAKARNYDNLLKVINQLVDKEREG